MVVEESTVNQWAHQIPVLSRAEMEAADPRNPRYLPPGIAVPYNPAAEYHGTHKRASRVAADVDIPDRFELFLLGDGEKKVTEAADTRTPNTSIFTFAKEDHTLANLLRAHLLKDPHVMFAGYRVPHPLFANFELRIQTDGSTSPKEALVTCCKGVVGDLGQLSREFTKEFELRKMIQGDGADK